MSQETCCNKSLASISCKPAQNVWYIAYGSNMSAEKFQKVRGIKPLETASVRLPGWELTLEIPGMPYIEPAYASIRPRRHRRICLPASESMALLLNQEKDLKRYEDGVVVEGCAYLITPDQWIKVIASEGGGIAYNDVDVTAHILHSTSLRRKGEVIQAKSLGTVFRREPWGWFSERYLVSSSSVYKICV